MTWRCVQALLPVIIAPFLWMAPERNSAWANEWPKPVSTECTVRFPDADRAELFLPILGESGDPPYMLECHSPAFAMDQRAWTVN